MKERERDAAELRQARKHELPLMQCRACKGQGKRLVPNKRERGVPPQDFGPAFYGDCPDCGGTGKPRAMNIQQRQSEGGA